MPVRPRLSNSLRMYGSTAAWTVESMWQPSWVPVAVHQDEDGSLKGSTVAKFTPQLFLARRATAARWEACWR